MKKGFSKFFGYFGKLFSGDPTVSSTRWVFIGASVVAIWLVIYKTLHQGLTAEDVQVVLGLCAGGGLPKIGTSVAESIGSILSKKYSANQNTSSTPTNTTEVK